MLFQPFYFCGGWWETPSTLPRDLIPGRLPQHSHPPMWRCGFVTCRARNPDDHMFCASCFVARRPADVLPSPPPDCWVCPTSFCHAIHSSFAHLCTRCFTPYGQSFRCNNHTRTPQTWVCCHILFPETYLACTQCGSMSPETWRHVCPATHLDGWVYTRDNQCKACGVWCAARAPVNLSVEGDPRDIECYLRSSHPA